MAEGEDVVLLVGGSPEPSSPDTLRRAARGCSAVVAIDRGLDRVLCSGIPCDLFCGDGDSVGEAGAAAVARAEADGAPFAVVRYNPHKDDTDLGLALGEVSRRWPGARVRACCLSGGAPDHLLGVMGRLAAWHRAGVRSGVPGVELVEDGFEGRILQAGESWQIQGASGQRFSFMVLSAEAEVSEEGMRWEIDRRRVTLLDDLGISNVIEAPSARIACHGGTVACWLFR